MIQEKREKLERFIREQTIGPGATGFRYIDIQHQELLLKNLLAEYPINYASEIINNVPGAVYSTAILFPVDDSKTAVLEADPDSVTENEGDVEGSHENISDIDISEDESLSINQMYPNAMGITCSLDKKLSDFKEVKVKVKARYYSKVNRKDIPGRYGLLLEQDYQTFRSFINSLELNDPVRQNLLIQEIGDNVILSYSAFDITEVGNLKARLRAIDQQKALELGTELKGQYLSGFKEFLFRKLKYNDELDKQTQLAEKIRAIEDAECSIAHLNDLVNIFDSRGYGLWKCKILEKEVDIPAQIPSSVNGKVVFNYRNHPELKDIFRVDISDEEQASLSINLQLSTDSRKKRDNIFLKVQLVNTSTPFTRAEGDARYFSVFNETVNQKSFFGIGLTISSRHLLPYRNVEIPNNQESYDEDDVTDSLYAQYKDFAIGHGSSVKWDETTNSVQTEYIPSFDTPNVDPTPKIKENATEKNGKFEPESVFKDSQFMQFKTLSIFSDTQDDEIIGGLKEFVNAYGDWINRKRESFVNTELEKVAEQELYKCERDKNRMLQNVDNILGGFNNANNLNSFRLMNGAMFMQLWHSVKVRDETIESFLGDDFTSFDETFYKRRQDDLFKTNVPAAWRPFQLAFILLNLDGIFKLDSDPEWSKRNEWVDLVWFPTGGGKTEAYLGIIALTIIHRRKTFGESGGGTAVLMRYTLRLLTLQQFQRATLLIMALELLRRWNKYSLGEEPIYIGLWVGQGTLPNSLDELEEEYQKIRSSQNNDQQNYRTKIPFSKCPWCGSRLNPISFNRVSNSSQVYEHNRIQLKCSKSDHKCSFSLPIRQKLRRKDHGPIPVSLCDEEIYQHPPALLFGTVDKFAQLAHKVSNETKNRHKDSRRIFGTGNWEKGKPSKGYLTPDLIIQDELHLLLGPLGSSVALFESAIDQLCTREQDGIPLKPKIISSTATTRNTELQIMALFNRRLNLFPKQGIECDDSFFAFYEREFDSHGHLTQYHSKRKYLGILPTGRTQMWMQMRLSAIILVHRAVFESGKLGNIGYPVISEYENQLVKAQDNYHTMLTYFNSLREVGKTESQINTYILKEIRRVFNRVLRPGKMMHCLYTYELNSGELTGRLSGEEVKSELDRVSSKWKPEKRFAHHNDKGVKVNGSAPPDIVVATNMISVGIDVNRFNTIIMNSMPRNLAEYIQASSRVARSTYGLVLTVHHPFRARDISHYEKFIEFHEKMYSYVEPISITPFTLKAVDRYLGLYLATMLRHSINEFTNRLSARDIVSKSEEEVKILLRQLSNYFHERERKLASSEVNTTLKNLLTESNVIDIEKKLRTAIDDWVKRATEITNDGKNLVFNKKAKNSTPEQEQLYVDIDEYEANIHSSQWQIPQSLRVIEPEAVIKIKSR